MMTENPIESYYKSFLAPEREICIMLQHRIQAQLPMAESKIWHGHPVWFIQGNPIVGFSKQKLGIRLMFWSGADFDEPGLNVIGKKFKDASVFYCQPTEINDEDLSRWLLKSQKIQWDYQHLIKRKGLLIKLDESN